jgi:sugar phosphate isomerase/epimerase
MRLGAPVFKDTSDPFQWVSAVQAAGYRAAYCPVGHESPSDLVKAYAKAAQDADIVIAEVGAWSNPMSPDEASRKKNIEHCQKQLHLAEEIGARCCVNITGSRGEPWDGPDARNLTAETFDMVVQTTRTIIDAVHPKRTYYTLETMPNMYPDSAESYIKLIHAIDREQCAAHFDPVNLVVSPRIYFNTGDLIRDFVERAGPLIRSCHAKDIILYPKFMVHLDETRPGTGNLDYATFLHEVNRLDPDTPIMLEHLPNEEEYKLAADYVRSVAKAEGISL